jgi:hypothetical protein
MLAALDLNCTRADIDSAAALHGRLVNATQEEIDAAATTVVDALGHPLMRSAAAISTGSWRREVPIMLRRDDETVVEGVVDFAFLEEGPDFAGGPIWQPKREILSSFQRQNFCDRTAGSNPHWSAS